MEENKKIEAVFDAIQASDSYWKTANHPTKTTAYHEFIRTLETAGYTIKKEKK